MAETLGDAWDSLTIVLEKRRTLLKLSLDFFENALEVSLQEGEMRFIFKENKSLLHFKYPFLLDGFLLL